MKRLLFAALMASPFMSQASACVVELQYQGVVLGQNIFSSPVCRDALRECKRSQKFYERNHALTELACEKVSDVDRPRTPVPTEPNPPGNGGGYNPPLPPNGNPGPLPPIPPRDPNYTRLDAMNDLEQMENDVQQASENYNLIMEYVDQRIVSLRDGVSAFGDIMKYTGGSSSTNATRGVFRYIMEETANGGDLYLLVEAYGQMARIENDQDQAMGNLRLVIDQAKFNGVETVIAIDVFTRMLQTSGASNTDAVRSVFSKLIEVRVVSLEEAVRDYNAIRVLENSDDDAMNNFELVLRSVREGRVRYSEAIDSMIELIQRYGSSSTSTIQSKYRQIYRI